MSEQTTLKLKMAEEGLLATEQELRARADELLKAVAGQIPDHAVAKAKRTAFDQPDVIKALSTEGIKELRNSIENLALQAAEDVAGAESLMTWPSGSIYSKPTFHEVHASVRDYLINKVAPKFVKVFEEYGFHFAASRPELTIVSSLYTEDDVAEEARGLCEALLSRAKAKYAVEQAKNADDEATVNELWGD